MNAVDNDMQLSGRASRWMLAIVVLIGALLRIYFLNSALWYDEIVTLVDSARLSVGDVLSHFPSNNHHPLYSLLAHLSIVSFGEHAWTLRLPAAIFGIAALPMLYVLGKSVTSRLEALAATALLAVSYHHIWFSQNARGYTILLFCALLGTYLLLIALRERRRSAYVGYAVTSALAAYTHLTMVFVVAGQAGVIAAHLLAHHRRRIELLREWINPVLGFTLAGVLTIVLYAPLLAEMQTFFGQKSEGVRVASAGWAIRETLRGLQLGYASAIAVMAGGFVFLTGCLSYLRQSPTLLALFLFPGALLYALAALMQRPMFPRFFFFLAGFGLLIVVRGAVVTAQWLSQRLPGRRFAPHYRRLVPLAFVASMIIVSLAALPSSYRHPKQDYEQALRYVEANVDSNELIVVAGSGAALPYQKYYGRPWKRVASAADLTAIRQQSDGVWLLYTFKSYIETLEADLMREILNHCQAVKVFPGTVAGGNIVVTRCGGR